MKMVFTTGEAADVCGVSQQTIIRCFDNGKLKGFRVPGSRFRRIPRDALATFMKDHGIPLDHMDSGKHKVLIVSHSAGLARTVALKLEAEGRFDVRTAGSSYEAGIITQQFMPALIVLDLGHIDGEASAICQVIRENQGLQQITVIATGSAPQSHVTRLLQAGADEYISGTDPEHLAKTIIQRLP